MARDRYRYFRIEARQLLEELTAGTLLLDGERDAELVRTLLRAAHTLKGAARVVGQVALAEHAHALEDLLEPLRDGEGQAQPELADSCLRLLDAIKRGIEDLEAPSRNGTGDPGGSEPRATSHAAPESSARSLRVVGVEIDELDRLLEGISEVSARSWALSQELGSLAELSADLRELGAERGRVHLRYGRGATATLARPLERAQRLSHSLEGVRRRVREHAEAMERELDELRHQAIGLRLVPVAAVFGDLERAVRDAAKETGKEVQLVTRGGETRLDSHVLAKLRGALVHLVRNAVAHGIEHAPGRASARKPAQGTVEVVVTRRGQRAEITCRDDGRGLDAQAIRQGAVERHLIGAERAAQLGIDEAVHLLLRGGVSTSSEVTPLSGRGVGLDAVRAAVETLSGEIEVRTRPGQGTTFELRVPVSLSSLPALAVEAGAVVAALPLEAVRRVVRLSEGELTQGANGVRAMVDGQPLPFAPLAALLGTPSSQATCGGPIDAVVLRRPAGAVALGVDRVRAVESVLLRSLPRGVHASPVVAGAAFQDAGPPCLVLSPGALGEAVCEGVSLPVAAAPPPPVLVVDDSLTTRMLERSILESAGYEVDLAVSAEEALEKASQRTYALFVVDVEMPGMNGFEFVARTRADPRLKEVPSILVTSLSSQEDRRRGKEVGARAYIVKSEFDQRKLLRTIAGLVGDGEGTE